MGIKALIKRAGVKTAVKAADTVSKLSVLSPQQLELMEKNREKYFSEIPEMTGNSADAITQRLLAAGSVMIYNEYLQHIHDLYSPVREDLEYGQTFKPEYNVRYFNITKWVTDKEENSLEKLVNVYEVLSNEECNIGLVFHRTMKGTEVYLAVTNAQNASDNVDVENYRRRLLEAIKGNFPGSEIQQENGRGVIPFLKNEKKYSVATASNIPGEKSEKFVSQTIEKLLDGIVPDSKEKEYTLILLATPVKDVENFKIHLAELYSGLAPYAGWQTNYTYHESDSTNSAATFGINAGVSAGVQAGRNTSVANSNARTDSTSTAESESQNRTETESESKGETKGDSQTESDAQGIAHNQSTTNTQTIGQSDASSSGSSRTEQYSRAHSDSTSTNHTVTSGENSSTQGGVGVNVGTKGTGIGFNVSTAHGTSTSEAIANGTSVSDTVTQGISDAFSETTSHTSSSSVANSILTGETLSTVKTAANTVMNSVTKQASSAIANSLGRAVTNTLGKAVTNTVTTTNGGYRGVNAGGNFGANFARSSNVSATVGKDEGVTQTFTNYTIKHTLEILEQQMKRYDQSTALGMWGFAAYVLSEDITVANNVAHTYLALTQGEQSYMAHTAVNLWRGDMGDESDDAREICKYLRELRHPIFGLNPAIAVEGSDWNAYPGIISATTMLSGKELAYSLNFPKKSVAGFPVLECAEFGRNIVSYEEENDNEKIRLGNVFHMNRTEETEVLLDKNSLCSHVFVTGSTGSGKSNTVYTILSEAMEQGVHFLVIEPAKGEYKNLFGSDHSVSVYGTNPYLSPMLRINPFSFPEEIHIFEHLDRLVEIFNVCWPMYAAMPAVLKNAIEKSYEDCGWNLRSSINKYGEKLYPTFADVARNIKIIIESSEYDAENKGAYKGSLLTRLQSLTNGINGIIFGSDEISNRDLFDKNVIVDLSRVGSSETKSLIMGMLVLKLQEHRMASASGLNQTLKHITVLEEAHNILRRSSSDFSSESGNLQGKSVEMISNAIAEMRTYGEGFVIVDQAPGLLDMAAIRNTNTKIIMRLPDQGDRELVGKAAYLNDNQIVELARLPRGVAAVYQNEWVQPVLCKVDRFETGSGIYEYSGERDSALLHEDEVSELLLECVMNKESVLKEDREGLKELKEQVLKSELSTLVKIDYLDYLESGEDGAFEALSRLAYDFLGAEKAIEAASRQADIREWVEAVTENLVPSVKGYSRKQIDQVIALVLCEKAERDSAYEDLLCRYTEIYRNRGGVL